MTQDRKSNHIVEIDAFRAWAILSVVSFHYLKEFYPGWGSFLRFGWTGVDLFFVISGFVMYLQVGRKYVSGREIHFRAYFRNRFLRIAPAFYASLLVEVIFLHRDKLFSKEFLMHLGFVHIFSYDVAFSIQPIYWSLAVEAQFYIFLILTAGLLTGRRAYPFLTLLMIFSLLYRYIVSNTFGFSHTGVLLINQLPGRLPQFISGMFLAVLYMEGDLRQSLRKGLPYVFISGILIYLICGLHWLQGGDGIFNNVITETLFHPLLGLSFAMIMSFLIFYRGRFMAAMSFKPMVFTGLISYSLYLWHFLLLEVINVSGLRKTAIPTFIIMMSAVAAVFCISTLSYYCIEKQFLKLKKR